MARDFYGFTFNGKHSYNDLHILRVSDGSRYQEGLLPAFSDKTTDIVGGDGAYYFGSSYNNRPFSIQIAYDNLSESDFCSFRKLFGDKKLHPLIFDEQPYKVYMAKVQSPPDVSYICFDSEDGMYSRVYKGEGNINFICYDPYAHSRYKWLEDYTNHFLEDQQMTPFETPHFPEWKYTSSNINEWLAASGIKSKVFDTNKEYDIYYSEDVDGIKVYNPGDIPADFIIKLDFNDESIQDFYFEIDGEIITFNTIEQQNLDYGIQINTKNNLIEGIDSNGNLTGTIYNHFIENGHFFKIPVGYDGWINFSKDMSSYNPAIEYDFLYL